MGIIGKKCTKIQITICLNFLKRHLKRNGSSNILKIFIEKNWTTSYTNIYIFIEVKKYGQSNSCV